MTLQIPMRTEASPSFRKRFKKKPPEMQDAITRCIKLLAEDPRHPGLNTHRMRGIRGVWECYVDAGNRVTFHYADDGHIVLRNHCNHDMLTRNP